MASSIPHAARSLSLLVLLISLAAVSVSAKDRDGLTPPANPYLDPKHDVFNPLRYIASIPLAAISLSLFFLTATAYAVLIWRHGARYMLCVLIGGYCMTFGLAMRIALNKNPDSSGLYIVEYLFVVLSPCAFIAGEYILLGRLAHHLGAGEFLFIRPARITKIFIASDITTFLIQAAGGGLSTSHNISSAQAGAHIFLAGLALQLASFFLFTSLYVVFLYRVQTRAPHIWSRNSDKGTSWYRDWRVLAGALALSCAGILIRSVYRTVELSQGYVGPLATNESLFYGLDTLPLFIAVTVYVIFWPGKYIDEEASVVTATNSTDNGVERVAELPRVEEKQEV